MTRSPVSAVVLLWHGRGPRESAVMQPLAVALANAGHHVLPVDWDCQADDSGKGALLTSLLDAKSAAEVGSRPVVVVGWSLGGTAALSLVGADAGLPVVQGVVGLAPDVREVSPMNGLVPRRVEQRSPGLHLVHGWHDTVVPVEASLEFARVNACSLTVVNTDHAGVIGTAYDPHARSCRASDTPMARRGLAAALAAVASVS